MEYDELVRRLRDLRPSYAATPPNNDAADAITKLRAERDALRALLLACIPELDGEGVTIHRVWAALAGEKNNGVS